MENAHTDNTTPAAHTDNTTPAAHTDNTTPHSDQPVFVGP